MGWRLLVGVATMEMVNLEWICHFLSGINILILRIMVEIAISEGI